MRDKVKQGKTISGQDLREMFAAATNWLEKSASDIDALNVFPVPDGDTGTNMFLTMRSSIEEAYQATTDHKVSLVAQAMAKGALMGARGNSGVILSQIWTGLARSLNGNKTIDGSDLADALCQASETAYKALANPVEGTILTVIREAASAAQKSVTSGNGDAISVLEATVNGANESVANTPKLLPVLREAGVVDAGGQGLYTLLEGALLYLRGDGKQMQSRKSRVIAGSVPETQKPLQTTAKGEHFGYCTQFMLTGEGLDPDKLREDLKDKGQSLIVVGDDTTIRVHIHTLEPDSVIRYATSLGTLHDINIGNMDEQHQDFLVLQKERILPVDMAIVAVVAGKGLADVFTSLGVSAIVPGGQTMNPSTKDILQAVEAVPSDKVIILPNNKNIVLTARQVESLTNKSIKVVPVETIPQGVAALIAIDRDAGFETNAKYMIQAIPTVTTIEITRATRSTNLDGLDIKKNQAIGLLGGKLSAAGDESSDVVSNLLTKIDLAEAEIITIYYGADTGETEAEKLGARINKQYPQLQVEIINGGQPHYDYIIGIE